VRTKKKNSFFFQKKKEASTEYKKKFKQKLTFQKVFVRVVVNLIITSMMLLSMLAIYKVSQTTEKDTFLKQVCFLTAFEQAFSVISHKFFTLKFVRNHRKNIFVLFEREPNF